MRGCRHLSTTIRMGKRSCSPAMWRGMARRRRYADTGKAKADFSPRWRWMVEGRGGQRGERAPEMLLETRRRRIAGIEGSRAPEGGAGQINRSRIPATSGKCQQPTANSSE
jgi:hypothetical protein